MKDENRKEIIERLMGLREKIQDSSLINTTISGDTALKSLIDRVNGEKELDLTLLHEIIHSQAFAGTSKESSQQQNTSKASIFSTDYDRYNEQLKDFLDYVALTKEVDDFAFIKVKREENSISYARVKEGCIVDRHEIPMTNDSNLKELYEELKHAYGSEFVYGCKHEMMNGWSLQPIIADKVIMEFSSYKLSDRNWIYEEVHNRPPRIIDEPKKK